VDDRSPEKRRLQLIWGVALVAAGLGVFYRIPQVMPQVETIEYFQSSSVVIRIFFYIMGAMLVYGGGSKLFKYFPRPDGK